MEDINNAPVSEYIIDGIRMDETPAQMLGECIAGKDPLYRQPADTVIDESPDPVLSPVTPAPISGHIEKTVAAAAEKRSFPHPYSGSFTRLRIAEAVIDTIWKEGHFRLENLSLQADWKWNCAPVGNMASFYFSAEAASSYIYDLGIHLDGYSFSKGECSLEISGIEAGGDTCYTDESEMTGSREEIYISGKRKCPAEIIPDKKSWLIYIPFDTCRFRLGGSVFSGISGNGGDNAPEIRDPDYFIDCFEVVRELVEDGIVTSGMTVADGGLAKAAAGMCRNTGCTADISGIASAYAEKDHLRILFAEIPGVIIQIRDSDYDYLDTQMLLQDIAFYPIGHPEPGTAGIKISEEGRTDVFSILTALMQVQPPEGED